METKRCCICHEVKSLDEFHKHKGMTDGRQAKCKTCNSEYAKKMYPQYKKRILTQQNARRDELKQYLWERKSVPCTDCGVRYPHYVMDFDHLEDKTYDISDMINRRFTREKIDAEIAKCDVVCSNCHRQRTHDRGWTGSRLSTDPTRVPHP